MTALRPRKKPAISDNTNKLGVASKPKRRSSKRHPQQTPLQPTKVLKATAARKPGRKTKPAHKCFSLPKGGKAKRHVPRKEVEEMEIEMADDIKEDKSRSEEHEVGRFANSNSVLEEKRFVSATQLQPEDEIEARAYTDSRMIRNVEVENVQTEGIAITRSDSGTKAKESVTTNRFNPEDEGGVNTDIEVYRASHLSEQMSLSKDYFTIMEARFRRIENENLELQARMAALTLHVVRTESKRWLFTYLRNVIWYFRR